MRQYESNEEKQIEELAVQYKDFLNRGKTERECTQNIARIAEENGYRNLEEILLKGEALKAGDKIYAVNMKKSVLMMQIGSKDLEQGMLLIGSHIDSPRLDIKQNPLYESGKLAYLDTHYYGGIKKYQWVASPMALHGTVARTDGTCVEISIGEDPKEPVIGVTDLLVHLSAKQQEKKGSVVIEGEALDVLVGSRPLDDKDEENRVKAYVLQVLKEKYGIEEEDFVSAELEVVPAGAARDFGLDSSMIMSYGQDDRICAFCSLMGFLHSEQSEKTKVCIFVDKEEIGSVGATGMQSRFLENTVAEVMECLGQYTELKLRRALKNSCMLSADVNAAYDPLYADAFEKNNASFLGNGAVISKYTGSRGKGGSNDASAEYLGRLRKIFDAKEVQYQTAELGKIDVGGGGTIAYIPAAYGMDVVDLGVAILNMHAPYEVSSKSDVYETSKCYHTFYELMND
jgi:aspartyl aminopeptidase